MTTARNKILITFDAEEFDTPLLHGISISAEEQMRVGYEGLQNVQALLAKHSNAVCTFYTTANFAQHYPEIVKQLAQKHEIASHTFYHNKFSAEDVVTSKRALEEIIGKQVQGIRMPNMRGINLNQMKSAGYLYDSSLNPTWLPGKYNNFFKPAKPYTSCGVVEIPASVVPVVRVPLFWLAFKNFPMPLYLALCKYTLRASGFLNLYFHPWEFADIASYKIPTYVKRPCGKALVEKLDRFLTELEKIQNAEFSTTANFAAVV